MPSCAAKAGLLLGVGAAVLLTLPALGQDRAEPSPRAGRAAPPPPAPRRERLPTPRVERPTPTPAPAPPPATEPVPGPSFEQAPAPPPPPPPRPRPSRPPTTETLPSDESELPPEELLPPPPPPPEYPEGSQRDPDRVGILGPEHGALGEAAWGQTHGRLLTTLLRRMDAPLPSRWGQILLRRALLSPAPTPRGLNPVDWVAERAWLLLRMGDADGARLLVAGVDTDRFTPKMAQVALETALATADPAGLCPLVDMRAAERRRPLIQPICAALTGAPGNASTQLAGLRRRRGSRDLDLQLTEKVAGAGGGTRNAIAITWDGVDRLDTWRFGLATATAVPIPASLYGGASPRLRAWAARAPLLTLEERLGHGLVAATLGVFSTPALVDLIALTGDALDVSEIEDSSAGRLQRAYGAAYAERREALRALWGEDDGAGSAYPRRILTGAASAIVRPNARWGADAVPLVEAMLASGHDRSAARWAATIDELEGAPAERGWALLAVGAPRADAAADGRIGQFIAADESRARLRSRMLVAALAGLGRFDPEDAAERAAELGFDPGRRTRWGQAIERAAAAGEVGTVMILAATGLQADDPSALSPANLYQIVRALVAVDEGYAARMIAAEVLSRT